jgi:hypothetical protein
MRTLAAPFRRGQGESRMTGSARAAPPFDAEAYVEQASRLIGLPIADEHRPGVVRNMALIARMAALVTSFPLEPSVESAPVFAPAEPER